MTSLFFDLIIFGFLTLDLLVIGGFILAFSRYRKFSAISIGVFIFLLLSGFTVFYGSFIEPKRLVVTSYRWSEISQKLAAKNDKLKIALLSDFHLGPYKKKAWVSKVVKKLAELKPDLVLVAGDFIFERYEPLDDFEPFRELKTPLGIFGVFGNHDYGETLDELRNEKGRAQARLLRENLEKNGIRVLVNETVEFPNRQLVIGGVDEIWTLEADIEKTFSLASDRKRPQKDDTLTRVLLAHNPDVIKVAKGYPIDFVIAGHTHAGQIRLPFWGSVPQIPTKLGNRYDEGLFYFERFDGEKIPLLITRGVGESGPRARLFAPPEIIMIE